MDAQYTAIVKKKGDWWIGWIAEVPGVNCQEHSRQELIETLRATLHEAMETGQARLRRGKNQRRTGENG